MRLKFDDLPRGVRDRIVDLSKTPADPRVLIATPDMGGGWFKYFTLVAGLGICGFCLQFLFERSRSNIAPYHDREVFAGLAGGVFLVTISVVTVVLARMFPPPPYKTGQWALRSYLMRLTRGFVDLTPLTELGKPTIVTVLRNGAYSGSRLELGGGWTFYFPSKERVEKACADVLQARESFGKAMAVKDARALAELDAFSECTLSGSWTSPGGLDSLEGPRSPMVPGAFRAVQWLGSLGVGAAVAALAFAMFQAKYTGH